MINIISEAIKHKQQVGFIHKGNYRVVEPHTLGYDNKNSLKLRAYQVSGFSESGHPEGWRLFNVNNISQVQIVGTFPEARQGYNYFADPQISQIVSKI